MGTVFARGESRVIAAFVGLVLCSGACSAFRISMASDDVPFELRKSLVLFYDFKGQSQGTRVVDRSGHGNDGIPVNVEVFEDEGRVAAKFGLTNSYVTVPNTDSLNPGRITLSAWIKTSFTDRVWRRIFDKGNRKGYDLTMCGDFRGVSYRGQICIEPGETYAHSDVHVADGNWHHVVGTFDGHRALVYVDGNNVGEIGKWTGDLRSTQYDLTIGANRSNPDEAYGEVGASFNGLMADVMIFNRALTNNEIAALYQSLGGNAVGTSSATPPTADQTAAKNAEFDLKWKALQAQTAPEGGLWLDAFGQSPPSPAALCHATDLMQGGGVVIGNLTFAHGIGPKVIKDWTMPVPSGATQFRIAVGLRRGAGSGQRAKVVIDTDGTVAATSNLLAPGAPPNFMAVDLAGRRSLTLRIEDAEHTCGGDDVILGGALFSGGPGLAVSNSDLPKSAWSGKFNDPVPVGVQADWPCWRGPLRTGAVINGPKLADQWPPSGPKKLWEAHAVDIGEDANSSPIVAQGRLFVCAHGTDGACESVACWDANTGQIVWQTHPYQVLGGEGSPCVVGSRLILQGSKVALCFDAATGRLLWQFDTYGYQKGKGIDWGLATSFGVWGDTAVGVGGTTYGLSISDGKLIWMTPGPGWYAQEATSVSPWTADGKTYAIFVGYSRFTCVDPADGRVLWSEPNPGADPMGGSTPAVQGDIAAVKFLGKVIGVYKLSIQGPQKLWDTPFQDHFSSPVIANNRLYLVGRLTVGAPPQACCRDLFTGKLLWSVEIGDPEFSSPAYADGKLFVLASRGKYLLIFGADSGKLISKAQVSAKKWASPTIADGKLYIRLDDDGTGCFDLSSSVSKILPEVSTLAAITASNGHDEDAMHSRIEPLNSADWSVPHCSWFRVNTFNEGYDSVGSREWVQYSFTAARLISGVSVYWRSAPTKIGDFNVPQSWQLEYKDGEEWKSVDTSDSFGVAPNIYNRVTFKPVKTNALRLSVQLQEGWRGGILQWKVSPSLPAPDGEPVDKYFDASTAESISCGWGRPIDNMSFAGNHLAIAGTRFAQGIGLHAPCALSYTIGSGWRWLSFYAGISADVKYSAAVALEVTIGGKQVYRTPILRTGERPVYVLVPIDGASELQLACVGVGASYTGTQVNICNVRLSASTLRPLADGPSAVPLPLEIVVSSASELTREQSKGTWRIQSGELVGQDGRGPWMIEFGSPTWQDYEFTMEAMRTADAGEGFLVAFRVAGSRYFYYLNLGGWRNQRAAIQRYPDDNGRGYRMLRDCPCTIETNRWYRIRVRCEGSHVVASLDDKVLLDASDFTQPVLSGEVGVGSWVSHVRYRNLKVKSLTGQVLFDGLP